MSIAPTITLPHDIIEPAPIGWWPLAPGWWVLMALLLIALVLFIRWQWRQWRHVAPLRQALREHQQITAHWQQQRDARQTAAALSALLKRVARWRYPTDDTAKLSGESWHAFLVRTGNGTFDAVSAAALSRFYQRQDNQSAENQNAEASAFLPPIDASLRWLKAQRPKFLHTGWHPHV